MSTSTESMTTYAWNEPQSAKTFALVGFIFFAIVTAGLAFATLMFFAFMAVVPTFPGMPPLFLFPFLFPFGIFLPLSVGLTIWAWIVMKDIDAGRYVRAQSPSLVLGILGLFVNIISGIFFLLAYTKLSTAVRYSETPPAGYQPTGVGVAGRYCMECGRAVHIDAKYCHHCGKALT